MYDNDEKSHGFRPGKRPHMRRITATIPAEADDMIRSIMQRYHLSFSRTLTEVLMQFMEDWWDKKERKVKEWD